MGDELLLRDTAGDEPLTPLLREDERVVLLPLPAVPELREPEELLRTASDERVDDERPELPETPEPEELLPVAFFRDELRPEPRNSALSRVPARPEPDVLLRVEAPRPLEVERDAL